VPTLVDDDFVLTESSSILKYLADKFNLALYPKDLKQRARVNEMMDWFNTGFYRDYGYGVVYPQIYPHHKRPTDDVQKGTIEWGKNLTKKWLKVLNDTWLGKGNKFLAGDQMTIADIFGAALLTSGHVTRDDFKDYPNVDRWLKNVGTLANWNKINEAVEGFRKAVESQTFVNV
jgi:glutathione S-transferase